MKPKPPVQLWDVMFWREILPGQQQSRPGLRSSHLLRRTFPSPNTESCPHICTYRRPGCRTWPGSCWCSSRWWSCRSRSTPAPGRWWRCSRWPPAPPGRTCPACRACSQLPGCRRQMPWKECTNLQHSTQI